MAATDERNGSSRRTAVLLDVLSFGPERVDENGERIADQPGPLQFDAEVEALGQAFEDGGYGVNRLRVQQGGELTAADMWPALRAELDDHRAGDVVIVHVLTHGLLHKELFSLLVLGSDGEKDHAADVTDWLLHCSRNENGPTVLFLFDVCFAGQAAITEDVMRRTADPGKVWLLAASGADQTAFGARFTRAVTTVLRGIESGTDGPFVAEHEPYVRLSTFAQEVEAQLDELTRQDGSPAQRITGSRMTPVSERVPQPFFLNPRFREDAVGRSVGYALRPADDLPNFPDADRFRADARCNADGDHSDFTGRQDQLRTLTTWLADPKAAPLQVISGRAGAGKSALVGVVVCAAHPALSEKSRTTIAGVPGLPARHDRLAAVHGRLLGVGDFVTAVEKQLYGTGDNHAVQALLDQLARERRPAVLVVDGLDEAADPAAVLTRFLVPLSQTRCADGLPACRVLVASRPDAALLAAAGTAVLDLDDADRDRLREDLEDFVGALLRRQGRAEADYGRAVVEFSRGVARTLTGQRDRLEWGEFPVARLFTEDVVERERFTLDPAGARELGESVPLGVVAAFELDRKVNSATMWVRPVLIALGSARGAGMPTEVIRKLAPLHADLSGLRPTSRDVVVAIESAGAYLRTLQDPRGETVYRLDHPDLVARLRVSDESGTCAALLTGVPGGGRDWERAFAYVRRHILEHLTAVGRATELLLDPDFLLCPHQDITDALSEIAEHGTAADRLLAGVALDVARTNALDEARPGQLALLAARGGSLALARAFAARDHDPLCPIGVVAVPKSAAETVERQPVLAVVDGDRRITVRELSTPDQTLFSHVLPASVLAVEAAGAEIAVCCHDGVVRVMPLAARATPRLELSHPAVRTMKVLAFDGAHVIVTAADSGPIRMWSVASGNFGPEYPLSLNGIEELTLVPMPDGSAGLAARAQSGISWFALRAESDNRRRPVARGHSMVTSAGDTAVVLNWADTGLLTVRDLHTDQEMTRLSGPRGTIIAATAVAGSGGRSVVTGDSGGRLTCWHWQGGEAVSLARLPGEVTSVTSCLLDGQAVVVCGSREGSITVIEVAGARVISAISTPTPARGLAVVEGLANTPPIDELAVGLGFGGTVIVTGTAENEVRVDHVTRHATSTVTVPGVPSGFSVLSRDDWAAVVTTDGQGGVRAWHAVTGEFLARLGSASAPETERRDLVLVGNKLATVQGRPDGVVEVRPHATGDVREIHTGAGAITALATWRYFGRALAAIGRENGTLHVLDLDDGNSVATVALGSIATDLIALPPHLVVRTEDDIVVFDYMPWEKT